MIEKGKMQTGMAIPANRLSPFLKKTTAVINLKKN
jgi:hypothetical protein